MFNNFTIQGDKTDGEGGGVFNQFVAPISSDKFTPKKDTVRMFLIVVLSIVILLAIGAFLYLKVLAQDIETKKTQLAYYDTTPNIIAFENSLGDMRTLSQRLKLLNSVYDSRIYVSQMMFPILESAVESSNTSYVYFNKFSLKKENNSNLSGVSISGVALDYPALYRQLNNFREGQYSGYIKGFKLDGFSLNDKGNIEFNISFDIDISTPSFVKYLNVGSALITSSSTINSVSSNPGPLFNNTPNIVNASSTANSNGASVDTASSTNDSNSQNNSTSTQTSAVSTN